MKTTLRTVLFLFLTALVALQATAQTSAKTLLINHGASACGSGTAEQQFFSGSLITTPSLLYSGSVGLPYGGVFSAYNPADEKIYYADISSGTGTKVYVMNYNFTGSITTPALTTPTYTYNYVLNQLCFDNQGNNYGFKSFNPNDGKAKIEKIDITTGNTISGSTRSLQFPSGHVPNTVGDGDIVVTPNGRLFATFGNSPSMLYELSDPANSGNMTVTFITNLPRVCYSIAYMDGNLTMAGSDGGGCYYYIWDINSSSLSTARTFPGGKTSADMSNLTLAVGASNQLAGAWSVTSSMAKVYYRIVVKNKGNVSLNGIQITDDLVKTFGAGNVMGVQVNMISNPGSLQLNPLYNGTTVTSLLLPGQTLDNSPVATDSVVIGLTVTAANLIPNKVYYNSAIASGSIGAGTNFMTTTDSTNNGTATRIDLDGNGVSDDAGENVQTPFVFTANLLPVQGLALSASKQTEGIKLNWTSLANENVTAYVVERSEDGMNFTAIGTVGAEKATAYSFTDQAAKSSGVYYHIKGIKADDSYAFSNTVFVKAAGSLGLTAYPNPFVTSVTVQVQTATKGTASIFVKDVAGRTLVTKNVNVEKGTNAIVMGETQSLAKGVYFIETVCGSERSVTQVTKQ